MSDWYDVTGAPQAVSKGASSVIRAEFQAVEDGITAKLPTLTGNGSKIVQVNAGGTALEAVSNISLQRITLSGSAATAIDLTVTSSNTTSDSVVVSSSTLTTGGLCLLSDTSSDTGARKVFHVRTTNSAASAADAAHITLAGAATGLTITTTHATGKAVAVASSATTVNVISIVGNALTTGSALAISSSANNASTRVLVNITATGAGASGCTVMKLSHVADASVLAIVSTYAAGIASGVVSVTADSMTSGAVVLVSADGLQTGSILDLASTSSSVGTRALVKIATTNAAAVNAACLALQNDGSGDAGAGALVRILTAAAANTTGAVTSFTVGATLQGYMKWEDSAGNPIFIPFYDAPTS